ncbi:hypothetical protein E8E15_001790 [Penicillium rubens]|nr:hypothetical protein E8E15_001790 [Penicillium rubens]
MNRSDYRYRPYTKKALSRQQNDHVLQAASSYHYLAGRHGKLSKKAVPSARRRQPSDPVYRPVCHSIDDGSNYEHSIHPPAEVDPDIEMAGGECVLYDPHLRHGTAAIGHDAAAVANTENTVVRVDPTSISQSRGLTTVIQRMNRSDYRYRPYTKKALSQQQNDHVLQAASSYHYLAGRHGKLSKKAVPSARRRQPSDPVYRPVCHSIDDGSNYEHSIHPPAEVDPDIEMAGGECVLYDPHSRHGTAAIGHDAAAVANTENTVERVDPTSISQSRGLTTRMNRSDYRYRPYTKKALSQQQNDHVLQAASSYHYLAGRHGKLIKKTVPSARRRQPSDPVYRTVCHSIDDGSNYEHSIHPPAEVDPDIEMAGGECVLYDPHLRHGTAAIGHDAAAVANTENTVVRVDPTSISQSRGLTTVIQRMNRSDYRYRPYTKKALSQQQNDHVLQAASSYHYLAGRHGKLSKKAVPSARRRQPSDPVYRPVCHSIDEGSNYEHSIHPPAEADLDIQVAGNAFVLYDRQLEPREATTDNGGDAMEDTGELVWSGDDNSDTAGSTTSSPGDTITELETLNYAHTVATLGSSRSSMVSSRSSVQRSSSSLDKGGLPSVTDISWTLVRSKSVSEMASESPRDPIVSWCPSTVSSPPEPRTSNQSETDLSVGPDIHATAYCISGRICEIEDIPPQAISNLQHFNGGIETVSELGLTDTGSASSASSEPKADTALAATTTKASTLPLPPLQPVAKDVHAEQWHTHTTDDHFASTLPYSEECYILDKDVYEPPPNPKNASSNLRLQPSEAVHNMSHQGEVVARLAKSQLEDTTEPKRTSQSHSTTIDFHQRRILAFNKHLHLRRKDHSPQTQNVSSSTLQTAPADATTSAARFEYQTPPRLDDYVFIVELNDEILVRSMEAAETEQIRHQIQTYEENTHVVFYTKALQRIPRPPSRNPCDPVDILCRLKVLVVMCTKWCIDDNIRAAVSEAVSKEQEIISYMCKKRKISGNVDGDRLLSNEQLYQRDGGERDNWQEYLPMSYREDETIEYTTERSEVALGKRRRNVQYD